MNARTGRDVQPAMKLNANAHRVVRRRSDMARFDVISPANARNGTIELRGIDSPNEFVRTSWMRFVADFVEDAVVTASPEFFAGAEAMRSAIVELLEAHHFKLCHDEPEGYHGAWSSAAVLVANAVVREVPT